MGCSRTPCTRRLVPHSSWHPGRVGGQQEGHLRLAELEGSPGPVSCSPRGAPPDLQGPCRGQVPGWTRISLFRARADPRGSRGASRGWGGAWPAAAPPPFSLPPFSPPTLPVIRISQRQLAAHPAMLGGQGMGLALDRIFPAPPQCQSAKPTPSGHHASQLSPAECDPLH